MQWLGITAVAIAGPSMEPALLSGDWWLVRARAHVRPGAVVLLEHPRRPGLLVAKRAIRRESEGWWVEGDNPAMSDDSRAFGPVPPEAIRGVLWLRYRRGQRRGQH